MSGFELPPVFWTDLAQWLALLVESQGIELKKPRGQYPVEELAHIIERTRQTLNAKTLEWDANTRSKVQLLLAYALSVYGDQSGKREPTQEAVACIRRF